MGTKLARTTNKSSSKSKTVNQPSDWAKAQGVKTFETLQSQIANASKHAGGALTAEDIAKGKTYIAPTDPLSLQGINDVGAHAFDYLPDYAKARSTFDQAGADFGTARGDLSSARGLLNPAKFDTQYNFGDGFTRSTDPVTGQQKIDFGAFTPASIAHYQNPYDAVVREAGLQDIDKENALAAKAASDRAVAASSFGGARHGVAEATTNLNAQKERSRYINTALKEGYDKAVAAREAERAAGITGIGMENTNRLAGAGALTNLGGADAGVAGGETSLGNAEEALGTNAQVAGIRGGTAKIGAGAILSDKEQAALDKASQLKSDAYTLPMSYNMASLGALNQVPQDSTQRQTGSSSSVGTAPMATPDRTGQLLGFGASLAGAALAPVTGGGSTVLASLLSDERTKTEKSEMDPAEEKALGAFRGVPVSTFKYKKGVQKKMGMPKGKRIGPMAQDWKGAFGGSSSTIDVGNMMGALTQAVKELDKRTSHLRGKHG